MAQLNLTITKAHLFRSAHRAGIAPPYDGWEKFQTDIVTS